MYRELEVGALGESLESVRRVKKGGGAIMRVSGLAGRTAMFAGSLAESVVESGLVPDRLLRLAIRRMLAERLRELDAEDGQAAKLSFVEACRKSPIALDPERANEQHYEVPPAFFESVLGPRLKYSCTLWEGLPEGGETLAAAEERMLARTADRAGLRDGMDVLDLGCGWGSLSLWAAERFPNARILAVSNSALQAEFIQSRARYHGLGSLRVTTADVNAFEPGERFDRVVSVEMFEHVRNHERLLARIADWLAPGGRLFVHHFAHREHAYAYEDRGASGMARHFFSGGMMPSEDWLSQFDHDLVVEERWRVPGAHYARTCEAWLGQLDACRDAVLAIFEESYGRYAAKRWLQRWRIFFLACAELFAYRGGEEWVVAHRLLAPRRERRK